MQNINNQLSEVLSAHNFDAYKKYALETIVNFKRLDESFSQLLKSIDIELIKSITKEDELISFIVNISEIVNCDQLSRQEKKIFLNGCENYLIQSALTVNLFKEAALFNSFKIDRDITVFKQFIFSMLKNGKLDGVLSLLTFSEKINFENSQLLKIAFIAGVRDINFYNVLVNQYNLDINEPGILYNSTAVGTFSQLVFASFDNNSFIDEFVKYYKGKIDITTNFITKSNKVISIIDMIYHNKEQRIIDRISRLDFISDSSLLNQKLMNQLIDCLFVNDFFVDNYESNIYFTIFTSPLFNSDVRYKNIIISKLVNLDFDDNVNKLRISNSIIDPVCYIFELLIHSSSQLITPNYDLLISNWLENSKSKRAPDSLIKSLFNVSQVKVSTFIRPESSLPTYVIEYFNPHIKKANFNLNIIQSEVKPPQTEINTKLIQGIEEQSIKKILHSIVELREQYLLISEKNNSPKDLYIRYSLPENINTLLLRFKSTNNLSIQEQLELLKNTQSTLSSFENQILEELETLIMT